MRINVSPHGYYVSIVSHHHSPNHPESNSVTHSKVYLVHRPPLYGVEGEQELEANQSSHAPNSWAHVQQHSQLWGEVKKFHWSWYCSSKQKEPSGPCISNCSFPLRDLYSAPRRSKQRSWELTTVIRLRHIKQSHP